MKTLGKAREKHSHYSTQHVTKKPQSKDSSRAALKPENRFQNGPIIAQVKGPKFKPKQRRVAFNHMVFLPAL